jgi:hypothetical protein
MKYRKIGNNLKSQQQEDGRRNDSPATAGELCSQQQRGGDRSNLDVMTGKG